MGLADLIHRPKNSTVLNSATAISAIPAILDVKQAENRSKIATIATIAVATQNTIEVSNPCPLEGSPKKPDLISAYCPSYYGHCSVKIGDNYPAECEAIGCEYFGLPDVPGRWGVYSMADFCPDSPNQTTQHTTCPCCHGEDFWESTYHPGHMTCRKCHEPAPGAELKKTIEATKDYNNY